MATFTRQMILQTFGNMLASMPLDKITVRALVRQCGVSANTFYYHFHDINELLEAWLTQEFEPLLSSPSSEWKDRLRAMLITCRERRNLIAHLTGSSSRDVYEQYVFRFSETVFSTLVERFSKGKNLSESRKKHVRDFCAYSFLGFIIRYLQSDMTENVDSTLDELADIYHIFLTASLQDGADADPPFCAL